MSMPPQPGPWGPGGPGAGPPQQPQGYGPQPGFGQQAGFGQQPQWGPPQPPPPKQGNAVKWLLGVVAVLLVIGITVGVTVIVTRDSGGTGPTETTPTGPPIASADDNGPVEIITLEPTCQAWIPVSNAMSRVQKNGWGDRDPTVPAVDWSTDAKAQYEAVGKSMRESADQAVGFARQTPHRVVRKLYEQFIAYSRLYADSLQNYVESDDEYALASVAASIAIDSVCNSITYGSAGSQSAGVPAIDVSTRAETPQNVSDPQPFVKEADAVCDDVITLRQRLIEDTAEWAKQDPNIPESEWSVEQRTAEKNAIPTMSKFADDIEAIGLRSENETLQDLAYFAAVYFRGYVNSLDTYVSADNYLVMAGSRAVNTIIPACRAAGR